MKWKRASGSFIEYVRTKGEGGSRKRVRHAYKGGVDIFKYVPQKKSLLSYFVVYGDDFHCCAKKHLL